MRNQSCLLPLSCLMLWLLHYSTDQLSSSVFLDPIPVFPGLNVYLWTEPTPAPSRPASNSSHQRPQVIPLRLYITYTASGIPTRSRRQKITAEVKPGAPRLFLFYCNKVRTSKAVGLNPCTMKQEPKFDPIAYALILGSGIVNHR